MMTELSIPIPAEKTKWASAFFILTLIGAAFLGLHFLSHRWALERHESEAGVWAHVLTSQSQNQPERTAPALASTETPLAGAGRLVLGKKINLNRAGLEDLVSVPGIGPKTAERILDARQKLGGFKRLEDLMQVKGIKEKKLAWLKKYLEIEEKQDDR